MVNETVIHSDLGKLYFNKERTALRDKMKVDNDNIHWQIDVLLKALSDIAEFDDITSNEYFARFDRYTSFDEPNSVQTARIALNKIYRFYNHV